MVPSWHVQRWINSFFVQFRCRVVLDCCRVGCGPLDMLDFVSISAGTTQDMVLCADLFSDCRSSGSPTDDANITRMKTEPNA